MVQLKHAIAPLCLLLLGGGGCRESVDPLRICLSAHHRSKGIEIQWRMRNVGDQPLWVPVAYKYDKLPLAFLTPDGELALVFGEFSTGRDRTNIIESDDPGMEFVTIAPGCVIEGIVLLVTPYRPQDGMDNPYRHPERILDGLPLDGPETKRRVEKITGVFAGVNYWRWDPSRIYRSCIPESVALAERWRATVSRALMDGRRSEGIDTRLVRGVATSNVISVDIPLKKAIVLHIVRPEVMW